MKITIVDQLPKSAPLLVIPVIDGEVPTQTPATIKKQVGHLKKIKVLKSKVGEWTRTFDEKYERVLLVGAGDKKDKEEILNDEYREAGGNIVSRANEGKVSKIVFLPWAKRVGSKRLYRVIEGMLLGNYDHTLYKSKKSARLSLVKELVIVVPTKKMVEVRREVRRMSKIVEAVHLARDLVLAPPNVATPQYLAKMAKKLAAKHPKMKAKVYDKKALEKMKMGLLLAVNAGSKHPAQLITLDYNPTGDSKRKPIVLIGKGIMFDTGGYGLKMGNNMLGMQGDMAGAAVALATVVALAETGGKRRVVAVVPATENMVSAEGYLPTSVIRSYSGKTVEIGHTDAEGRLILADAISWAQQQYAPKMLVDLATLTGSCMHAIGVDYAALMGNDSDLKKQLQQAAEATDEEVCEFPLTKRHHQTMKSKLADLNNVSSAKHGGTSTAAAFLEEFVDAKVKWAHLDIAGPGVDRKGGRTYEPPTIGSGYGVRLMYDWLINQVK